jgi:hypothetical protein
MSNVRVYEIWLKGYVWNLLNFHMFPTCSFSTYMWMALNRTISVYIIIGMNV